MNQSQHGTQLITPYASDPTKPLCIRVFLNDDETQYGVDVTAAWGNDPPVFATTVVHEDEWKECGECGHYDTRRKQVGTNWFLTAVQPLAFSDGIVAYYKKEVQ